MLRHAATPVRLMYSSYVCACSTRVAPFHTRAIISASLSPLRPAARAAALLLTSPDLPRLRECAARECAWLFLDRSRNGTRRWCDMTVCGNREKARRFQRRARGAGA